MFDRIIVPLDGSKAAEVVFPYVTEIAATFDSKIFLTHVSESSDPAAINEYTSYLKGATLQMKSQLESRGAHHEAGLQTKILTGNPAVEILKYAREIDCGLIAMASRGVSSEGPWTLGNIAAKILRASSFPVLLVRKQAEDSKLIEKKLIQKILVPLDGSKLGEAAIPLVTELSNKTGAEIVLFRVVEPISAFVGPTGEMAWSLVNTYEKNARYPVLAYLERTKESLKNIIPVISTATGEGLPADQIVDYAQANTIDLIAMSTHGRSGIGRWVFGSVTEKVLHAGEQPVLVVRPKGGTAVK